MIVMDSIVIPRPPALPPVLLAAPPVPSKPRNSSSRSSNNSGFRLMEDQGDTGSVYSIYKQKIDAMFESDSSSNAKNSVQDRIEMMFTDVAKDGGIPLSDRNSHSFTVDYLGSVGLNEKVTSLSGLQTPLRDLYFAYKRTKVMKALTGRLEISGQGLKVQYQGEKGDLEQLNSFPTIAVWSAVKFVIQGGQRVTYAFLPLITDPDNIDKKMLFRELNESERRYIAAETHSPLFAVVMRKIGVQKQLECHGFVCQTSEDAIVIAATLYKSLMEHMKLKEKKPKSRNGITCMSVASSTFNEASNATPVRPPRKKRSTASSIISENETFDTSDNQPLIRSSKKSPKKSTKSRRAPKAPDDFDAILPYEEPIKLEERREFKTSSDHRSESTNRVFKPIPSLNNKSNIDDKSSLRKKDNTGDIFTKVTIPRSGSFLNAGGLTRYKSKVSRSNGQATGGSPLGFSELFNEFRLQEGLHSLDEILGVIIDPEGMSFNDLKPIYKEFLLKLSVTLTKDELYQRSKMIMRRHKKKLFRRNSLPVKNHHILVGGRFKRLKHIFKRNWKRKQKTETVSKPRIVESSISTSSYDTRQFSPKADASKKKYRRDGVSTSEESDFFSIRRKARNTSNQNRNSSSGYVSCSECSYDSDTCTCVSADKCYCSLGNKNPSKKSQCLMDASIVYCGCDTDSCAESNKCYCHSVNVQKKHKKLCKKASNTVSTTSLEYKATPLERFYERRNADYEPLQLRDKKESLGVRRTGSNDPLSVKKSAEIAALFTDIKLTQTTNFGVRNSSVCSRNSYNKLKSQRNDVKIANQFTHRMVQNALYNRNTQKGNMYSTRNGLYTIQSQSDESRRSSMSEKRLDIYKQRDNLENSLGYLP